MLRCSSMTKFLFLTDPHPQETSIIRAMETGNTSPSLSFSPSSLWPPSAPSHLFSLSIFLYLLLCLSPFLPISVISDVHLFVQIIRCRDLRVRLKMTPGMVIRVGLLEMRMWLVPDCVVSFFSRKYWLYLAGTNFLFFFLNSVIAPKSTVPLKLTGKRSFE